ncbi:MAG: hypothetical protein LBF78_05600 [Treponema sp.]|jgi:hypothetical protein|nr:hypothetical protein [Treponema sp.]
MSVNSNYKDSVFLIKHSSEVINMLLTEWNIDDAKVIWREEGREEGIEEERETILDLIRQGYTAEQIEKRLTSEVSKHPRG